MKAESKPAVHAANDVTHTELPWELRHDEDGYPCIGAGICFITERVWSTDYPAWAGDTEGRRKNGAQAEANARLIVRAVNSHAALVEALRGLLTMMDRGGKPRKLDEALTWLANDELARSMAERALALAEEQK